MSEAKKIKISDDSEGIKGIKNKNIIQISDPAVIVLGSNTYRYCIITPDGFTTTQFGKVLHNDLIGKRYGVKIELKKGFIRLLKINPRLWAKVILHKTQIIYPTDCSFIVSQLDLRPGKVVFEAGTGSASLTHFLAQAVQPTGKVLTSEFHEDRAELARKDLGEHGLLDTVEVFHRDVINEGLPTFFHKDNVTEYKADAVILDMPNPWNVIAESLDSKFNPDRLCRLCVFLPCIEQVQKAVQIMTSKGYIDIKTFEVLLRNYRISKAQLNVPNMGQNSIKFLSDTAPINGDSVHGGDRISVEYMDGCQLGSYPHSDAHFTIPSNEKTAYLNMIEPEKAMPGHTGFLTFATRLPIFCKLEA